MVLLFYLALMALAAAVTLRTQMCVCERETEVIGVSHRQAREVVPFGNDTAPEVQRKVFNWIRQKFFCLFISFSPSDTHIDSIDSNKPY